MFPPKFLKPRTERALLLLAMALSLAALVLSCVAYAQKASAADTSEIPGSYTWTNTTPNSLTVQQPRLRLHSQDAVVLDIYVSFQCPFCQRFYPQEQRLAKRYGDRLTIQHHYLALDAMALNEDLRLYLVALDAGQGERAADRLMRAQLDERDGKQMLLRTHQVAVSLGLSEAYEKSLSDPAMDDRIDEMNQRASFVQSTPTMLVNGQLQLDGDLANAQTVIDGVLR